MPWGHGTGPLGRGPISGRGLGYCAGYNSPGAAKPGLGRGLRRGMGRGNFWGPRLGGAWCRRAVPFYPPAYDPSNEKEQLKSYAEYLEHELSAVRERLKDKE